MLRRLVAAGAGAAVAAGFYGVISAGVAPTSQQPMQAKVGSSDLNVAIPPPPAADPTPVRLVIPAIGVDAKVEARGLDSDRNLATANDFRDVAWYNLGPRPGEPGNAILNGHVNWWTGDAVFTHLSRVRAGDTIEVERADHVVLTFRVTSSRTVDANARIASLFAPGSASTMTLITCSGVWNPLTNSDTRRLLVDASLV
jgi:LPXTG-site transpeptidase (sortase) family protein